MSIHRTLFVSFLMYICRQRDTLSCEAQRIKFGVSNRTLDGVFVIGERNIVLRCCVEGLRSHTIKIENPLGESSIAKSGELDQKCLDFTIYEVRDVDGGEYRCTVNYTCVHDVDKSEVSIHFHIWGETISDQCIRNGTIGEPYKPGDWLLMSCYCEVDDMCVWKSIVDGTSALESLDTWRSYQQNGQEVVQALVFYAKDMVSEPRYSCFYIDSGTGRQQCSIGPAVSSSDDVIINYVRNETAVSVCPTPTTLHVSTFTNATEVFEGTSAPGNIVTITLFGVGTGGVIFISFAILITLIVTCRKRVNRRRARHSKVKQAHMSNNDAYSGDDDTDPTYYNQDSSGTGTTSDSQYHNDDGAPSQSNTNCALYNQGTKRPGTCCITSPNNADASDSTSHRYDSPGNTQDIQENMDAPNDDYAEVGESVVSLHHSRGTHPGQVGVTISSAGDTVKPTVDYDGAGEPMESQQDIRQAPFGSDDRKTTLYSTESESRRQGREPMSGEDGTDDFSLLYAVVNKRREGEANNTPMDFSGLYAQVNKPRESEQYQ